MERLRERSGTESEEKIEELEKSVEKLKKENEELKKPAPKKKQARAQQTWSNDEEEKLISFFIEYTNDHPNKNVSIFSTNTQLVICHVFSRLGSHS